MIGQHSPILRHGNFMNDNAHNPVPLTRYAWLSIAAAVLTILLKTSAYFLTEIGRAHV